MKKRVSITWAGRHFAECLTQIRRGGDGFVLCENHKPVAEPRPPAGARRATLRELCDALAVIPVDEDFASNLQSVNATDTPLDNAWDSFSTPRH